jgi:hypothetical protein
MFVVDDIAWEGKQASEHLSIVVDSLEFRHAIF